jgi:hypothetical protein
MPSKIANHSISKEKKKLEPAPVVDDDWDAEDDNDQ